MFKRNLVDVLSISKKYKTNAGNSSDEENILRMESLAKTLVLIDLLKETEKNYELIDFEIMDVKIINKQFRKFSVKEENNYLVFFSIFIILQSIIIIILFRENIFSESSLKIKIKRLIGEINKQP